MHRFLIVALWSSGSAETYGWRRRGKILWEDDCYPSPDILRAAAKQAEAMACPLEGGELERVEVWALEPKEPLPYWVSR